MSAACKGCGRTVERTPGTYRIHKPCWRCPVGTSVNLVPWLMYGPWVLLALCFWNGWPFFA